MQKQFEAVNPSGGYSGKADKTTEQPIAADYLEFIEAKEYVYENTNMPASPTFVRDLLIDAYRHLHSLPPSPVGGDALEWVDVQDGLPTDHNQEYNLRYRSHDGWEPLTGFFDYDAKEFYVIEHSTNMTYLSLSEFPGLQWLKESASPTPSRAGEISPALRRIKEAYFDGFNQAHYAHVHPELFPAGIKECEQAAEEYMAEKFPPTPAPPERPPHVPDPNGNIREDIMDWIRQHPDANYVTMHGVYTGFDPNYWAGVMRMYRQQLPVIAKLTEERDAARQDLQKMIDELEAKADEAAEYRKALEKVKCDPNKHPAVRLFIDSILAKYPNP